MTKKFYNIVHKNTTFVFLLLLFCIHAIGQNKYAGNTSKRSFASDMAYASNTKSFGYKRMNELSTALVKVQDTSNGLWYQLPTLGTQKGNYLEASCANMYVYAFAKGVRTMSLRPSRRRMASRTGPRLTARRRARSK